MKILDDIGLENDFEKTWDAKCLLIWDKIDALFTDYYTEWDHKPDNCFINHSHFKHHFFSSTRFHVKLHQVAFQGKTYESTAEILVFTQGKNYNYSSDYLAQLGELLEKEGFTVTVYLEKKQ